MITKEIVSMAATAVVPPSMTNKTTIYDMYIYLYSIHVYVLYIIRFHVCSNNNKNDINNR